MYLCELHIIQNIERKASKNIVGRAKSDRKARAGSVLNLLFLFIGGFMSNKEERMNRNKSIIEDYQTKAGKAHGFNRGMIGRTLDYQGRYF